MASATDIYNLDGKIKRYQERVKEDERICPENKQSILSFFDYCFATGLSKARVVIYAQRLFKIAVLLAKPFREASKQDLQELALKVELNPAFSPQTKSIYRVSLKKFYKWLYWKTSSGGLPLLTAQLDWALFTPTELRAFFTEVLPDCQVDDAALAEVYASITGKPSNEGGEVAQS
ncbi:MAG: hypothetical protein QW343_01240 [Candidatus Norongarragalinales archaeon]